jgi:chromosome segregation ATPase
VPTILEALRGRMQQRQGNAVDTIAAGARAAARGERHDVVALEKALLEVGMTMADFEEQVERAGRRAAWLADFDRLTSASAKKKKLEAAAEAERAKFEATRAAYFERASALDDELRAAATVCDKGREARQRLLDPREVPGTLGDKFRQATEEAHAAEVALEAARRAVREQRQRIKEEQDWIEQLLGEAAKEIHPARISLRDEPRRESPRLEEHRNALARAERRLAEAEPQLREAEKREALARRVVEGLEPEVLKA